jgi:hypothetical protein
LTIINAALLDGIISEQWLTSVMVLLFKKGDPADLGNYRSIAIVDMVFKLAMRMVLNRVSVLDPHLRNTQNGFRRGRSTTQHVLFVRRLIEETEAAANGALYLLFIDFSKAFDTVKWPVLWAILRAYRIPDSLIALIRGVYESSRGCARTADGMSGFFAFLAGVKQGCPLSPFLFIVVLDFVMSRAIDPSLGVCIRPGSARPSSRNPSIHVADTGFADDVMLMSGDISNVQRMVDRVVAEAARAGLVVNITKTELLAIGTAAVPNPQIHINDKLIKLCVDFCFLGSWIRSSMRDFGSRRAVAWHAAAGLRRIWDSTLPRFLKRRLLRALIEPILLYGAEAWTLTANMLKRLDGTYTRLLRFAQRVSYLDHMTNADLYAGIPRLSDTLRKRRLQFIGHCARADQPIAHGLFYQTGMPARLGRPRKTYVTQLCEDTALTRDEVKGKLKTVAYTDTSRARLKAEWNAVIARRCP